MRNVVGPATAGVSPEEVFDPTPYLTAYVRFGVRHPITQNFPPQVQVGFYRQRPAGRGGGSDPGPDLRVPSTTKWTASSARGSRSTVAAARRSCPRLAKPLYEWVSEDDYLRVALAVWTVFNNAEMLRKNRMMARLKVLIDRIGLDEFRGHGGCRAGKTSGPSISGR